MWQTRILTTALVLTSLLCFVVAQQPPQQDISLDALIESVFPDGGGSTTVSPTTKDTRGSLKDLIDAAFPEKQNQNNQNQLPNRKNGADPGATFLGVNNQNPSNPDDCICVPYYQCQNGTVIDNGIGLIDIRLSGPCDNYLDICCKPPNILKPDPNVTPAPVQRKGCGQRNVDGVGFRITGQTDNEAQFGEFPWMVAILQDEVIDQQKGRVFKVYQCGGALIHRQAVLTAAHCVHGKTPASLKVRAGEWDTQTKNEIFPHQDRDVSKILVHENFHSGSLHNDYAILILSSPVDYAENVDVVCLPEQNAQFDFARCFATGWGKNIFGKEGQYQVILKRVELPVVPQETCQNTLRNTRLGRYFVLNKSFICAGGEPGKDTCKGDGGSPLVCPVRNDPSRFYQAGIVAWGIGCGENGVPGVYANIANARRWIDETMAYNNLETTEYQYYN